MKIAFTIPIRPCAWQRAGKFGKLHFTPKKTANFEAAVRFASKSAMAGKEILDEPLDVSISFVYSLNKGARKNEKQAVEKGTYFCKTTKPDIDNLIKAVLDGMNGIVYRDDACVWCITAMKTYCKNDEIRIIVSTANDEKGS